MVNEDLGVMYDQILEYIKSKQAYYADPTSSDIEFSDLIEVDLASAIDTIQRQVRSMPNVGEAYTSRGYRHIRANQFEYDIRLMTRGDYWADAALEEQDNYDKWTFNKVMTNTGMNGNNTGSA